mmetsp:Transcript_29833/g.54338  ORF Transcript_29833/g.54338 Transcript_29833/m.54338 type:complete len:255 (+) Transcript_29833:105-869(+)
MAYSQGAPQGASTLLMLVLGAAMALTTCADENKDCVTNALSFTMQMVDVNIGSANYASSMQTYVANALNTLSDCVTIEPAYTPVSATPRTARLRRLDTTVFSPGIAGVASSMTQQQLQVALMTDSFKQTVCSTFKTSDNCTITDVWSAPVTTIGTTTTTTDMPWGLPWWVWFFIYLCCLALCGICGGVGAGASAGGSRKKKSPYQEPSRHDEPRPQYEVVDVPGPGPYDNPYNNGPGSAYGQPPYNTNPYSGYY